MNASSSDSEEDQPLGQEELDMSIFGNQDCHRQVIHVGRNEKNSNIGKVTQYNKYPHENYQPNRRWRPPYGKSRRQTAKRILWREKTPQDFNAHQRNQHQEQLGNVQQTFFDINVEHKLNSPDLAVQADQKYPVNTQSLDIQVPKISQERQQWFRQEQEAIVIQQNGVVPKMSTVQVNDPLDDKDFQIQVIELRSQIQLQPKRRRKPKKEIIASLNVNEESDHMELSLDRRTRNQLHNSKEEAEKGFFEPFNFVRELEEALESNYQSHKQSQFFTAEVVISYKGPISILKIKSIGVNSLSDREIKIFKNRNSTYKCEEKYSNLIEIKQNIFQARREYDSVFKQAKFQLCRIRLPISSFPANHTYTKDNFTACPIQINRISITCFCSRKFETVLSSMGVTCSYCSLPSEFVLKSITLNSP